MQEMDRKAPGIAQNLSEATQKIETVQRNGIGAPTAQILTNLRLAEAALRRARKQVREYKAARLGSPYEQPE